MDSRDRFDLILEVTTEGYWDWNLKNDRAYLSPRYCELVGYSPEDTIFDGHFFKSIIHPDDRDHVFKIIEEHLQGKSEISVIEYRMISKNGTTRWIEGRGKIVEYDELGAPARMVGTIIDITKRKQVDENFLSVMSKLPDVVVAHFDRSLRHQYVSSSIEKITGQPKEYFIGKSNRELGMPELLVNQWEEAIKNVFESGQPKQMEFIYPSPEGSKNFSAELTPGHCIDGLITNVICTTRDITELKKVNEYLVKSEAFYKESLRSADIGSYHADFIANKWESSEVLNAIFGIDGDYDRSIQGWLNIVHPDDRDLMDRYLIEEVISNRRPFSKEYRIIRQNDGEIRWVNGRGSAEFDSDGNMLSLMGTIQDITERKHSEELLVQSRELLFNLTNLVPGVVYQYRLYPDGRSAFPYSSQGMNDIYEVTPEEVREDATPVFGRLHPDDYDNVSSLIMESARTLQTFYCEFRVILPRQGLRWRWSQAQPERTPDGGTLWHGIISDITDRKLAENDLKHTHELMSYIIYHNQSALAVHDKDMRYIYVSQRYLDDYKVKDSDIIGKHHYEVFPDLPQKWRDVHKKALEGDILSSEEDSYEREDGTVEWTRWECRPWYEANGEIGGIILYTEVITERKRAEENKVILQNQLQQAQKMESIGRLAGGVAHDFNNMLSVILGRAELGLMHIDPSHRVCADLKEIIKTAERSADLTRQLLAFARKQTIAPKVIDLNESVAGMFKMLQRLIGEHISLTLKPAAGLWPVKMDASQLDQILANLCVNARDAIADVGMITIETENCTIDAKFSISRVEVLPGKYVKLSVSDNGSGIDKETKVNIFEPFFTTKELGKGTGLGLATVYGAVKQNNGYIDVYSELGIGTTFTIYLPRFEGKSAQVIKEGGTESHLKCYETILLVEDEPSLLEMVSLILKEQGYNVLAANNPNEAIQLAREHAGEIHLLMTDVVMPEMNGKDLAKYLLTIYPGIKRLFMSGYTADVISHHGVLDDGVHFIQKPFNLNALAGKLREILDN